MTNDSKRMRPWPEITLPVPRVAVGIGHWESTADGKLLQWEREGIGFRHVSLPDEFWMREVLHLDLDDPAALARFTTEYGLLDPHALGIGPVRDRTTESVYVEDLIRALRHVRNIARIVMAVASDRPRDFRDALEDDGLEVDDRVKWAIRMLDPGLAYLHPRIVLVDEVAMNGDASEQSSESLYATICAQVYNFIVERPHLSTCQKCEIEYVHQRGRSRYKRHRPASEVQYCSAECAGAAASLRYRQRQRMNAAEGGETK